MRFGPIPLPKPAAKAPEPKAEAATSAKVATPPAPAAAATGVAMVQVGAFSSEAPGRLVGGLTHRRDEGFFGGLYRTPGIDEWLAALGRALDTGVPAARRAEVKGTKSGRARAVDIDAETVKVLEAWKAQRGQVLAFVRPEAVVFGTLDGGPRNPMSVSEMFTRRVAKARKALGADALPTITLHGYATPTRLCCWRWARTGRWCRNGSATPRSRRRWISTATSRRQCSDQPSTGSQPRCPERSRRCPGELFSGVGRSGSTHRSGSFGEY